MASYHFSVSTISRSVGRSATAAAAYRAGQRVVDQITGEVHDYRRRGGVESVDMVLPEGAPAWDRSTLWNEAERAEKRRNSCVAREIKLALPDELTADQRRALVLAFVGSLSARHGVAVDVAIHAPSREGDQRNHHAHLLMTTRRLGPDGLGTKTREWDDRKTGPALTVEWRAEWARLQNEALERHGHAARVDHRSLVEQGITDRDPSKHDGPARTAVLRKAARKVREAVEQVQRIEAELSQAVAEKAAQVAAAAAATLAAAVSLPVAAEPVPVVQGGQVSAATTAPQAPPQRPARADPQPVRAAVPPQTPQGQGQDRRRVIAPANPSRGAGPGTAPAGLRVIKTDPSGPLLGASQERLDRARSALQRVRDTSTRLQAAEAAQRRLQAALQDALDRRDRHGAPEAAAAAEAVARARVAELSGQHAALARQIEGRGLLARLAAKVSDPEADQLDALWSALQQARQDATAAGTRAMDARGAYQLATEAGRALRDASRTHQEAARAAEQAAEGAKPFRAEIEALARQEADQAAREWLAQAEAEQRRHDDGPTG